MAKDGILVVGSSNMDMVVLTENFPKPGETLLGKKFQTFSGGKGANQAVGVAKLGAKNYFITKMGNDEFKNKLSENLESNGVNTDDIIIDNDESTGIAVIFVDANGQNEIVVVSGSNMLLTPEEVEAKSSLFEKSQILLTQLEILLETIIKSVELAKKNNMIVILNPAPARHLPDHLLSMVDYLTPNETELETLTGLIITDEGSIKKAANMLITKGVKNVIVTLGDKGSFIINKDKAELFSAREVKVLDTTAAGDAFNAGLAFALSQKYSLEDAVKFSNVVASIAVTKMGAQSSMPNKSEVMALL
jgi:ribokinase